MNDDASEQCGQRHGPPGEPADVVTAVAALRRTQQETDAIARESAGLLSELAPKILDLEQRGATVEPAAEDPAVTAAKAELGMRPMPPTPWCWPLLDDEQAAAAWDALTRWVDRVLVPGYDLTRGDLPDCWPQHPRMVNELSWLRASYLEAHSRGAEAHAAEDWHLRALPGALQSIHTTIPIEAGPSGRPRCAPARHLMAAVGMANLDEDELRAQAATAEHRRTPTQMRTG